MADSRDGYVKVGFEVDQNSVNATNQATAAVETRLLTLQKATQSIGDAAQKTGRTLQDAFSHAKDSLKDDQAALEELRAGLRGAADDADKVSVRAESLRRGGGALSQLGSLAGVGRIGEPLSIAGDIAEVGKVGKELGDTFKALPGILGNTATEGAAVAGSMGAVLAVAAPLALAAGAVAIAVGKFNEGLAENKKALESAITANDTYYKAIQIGTTESLKKQLEALKKQKDAETTQLQQLQAARDKAFAAEQQQFGGDAVARLKFAIGDATGAFKPLDDKIAELQKSTINTAGQIAGLEQALGASAVAANDTTEAEKKLTDQRVSETEKYLNLQIQAAKDRDNASADSIKSKIKDLSTEQDVLLAWKQTHADWMFGTKAEQDEYNKVTERIRDLSGVMMTYGQQVLPAVIEREKAKAMDEQSTEMRKNATKAAEDEAAAEKKLTDQRVAIVEKLDSDLAAIDQKAAEERLAIDQKFADTVVALAQKEADAAVSALQKLEQAQADLAESFAREEAKANQAAADKAADITLKAQREEAKSLEEHLRRLKDIRDSGKLEDQQDLLNRNFLGIYQRSLQKQQQIDDENKRYAREKQDRLTALEQERSDLARSIAREQRDRLQAYQQQQADAQKAYQRELVAAHEAHAKALEQAKQAHQKELAALEEKHAKELSARRAAAVKELQLTTQTEAEKEKIFKHYLKEAQDILANISRASNNQATHRAGGGYLDRGQMASVNEAGSSGHESFNGVPLPGAGWFIPSRAGYVDPNGGTMGKSSSTTNTFYITSHDPAGVRREVIDALQRVLA